MTASYEWWQNALVGAFGPISDGYPEPGFYRKRESKAAGYLPAAIWPDESGAMLAVLNGHEVLASDIWTYVCQYPVSEERYRDRMKTGKWWDEDEAVTASLTPPPASQEIGANNPPTDPHEVLKGSIEAALAGVDDYAKVETEEAASKAQSLRSRLNDLSGDADKHREKFVRPHLDAQRAVNDLWNPLVKSAKAGADKIKAAISAFETAEKRKRDAAEAERQRLAQKAARDVAEAQAAAAVAGQPAPAPTPPVPVPQPVPEPVRTQVRGAYGKAASLKTKKIARVVDYAAATMAMVTHPELKAIVDKLAQRAVDAGVTVAGVEFEEIVDVR